MILGLGFLLPNLLEDFVDNVVAHWFARSEFGGLLGRLEKLRVVLTIPTVRAGTTEVATALGLSIKVDDA